MPNNQARTIRLRFDDTILKRSVVETITAYLLVSKYNVVWLVVELYVTYYSTLRLMIAIFSLFLRMKIVVKISKLKSSGAVFSIGLVLADFSNHLVWFQHVTLCNVMICPEYT